MTKLIQVRNVPDPVHRELVRRARRSGQSLSAYIREVLQREASQPSLEDVLQRIADRPAVDLGRPAAEILREERTQRDGS